MDWIIANAKDLTMTGAAIAVLIAGAKEVWVWGYLLRRQETLTKEWKTTAEYWQRQYMQAKGVIVDKMLSSEAQ